MFGIYCFVWKEEYTEVGVVMRCVISGGGTGGHIYPALAIAEGIQKKYNDVEIIYAGSESGPEKDLAQRAGLEFRPIPVAPLTGRMSLKLLASAFKNFCGVSASSRFLKSYKPDIVIGTGGYVCGPVMLAATKCNFPTLLHEQNAVMGRANKMLSDKVDKICLTFNIISGDFKEYKKSVITGLPVREKILSADKAKGIEFFGLDPQKKVVLITGGSQGARHINQVLLECVPEIIKAGGQVLHLAGPKLYEETLQMAESLGFANEPNYKAVSYLHEMEMALGAADIVICRSGASFLAEVMAVGRASILIPYPYAIGDHQRANAMSLVNRKAAAMVLDSDLNKESLWSELQPLLTQPQLIAEMSKNCYEMGCRNAVDVIVEQIDEAIKAHNKK